MERTAKEQHNEIKPAVIGLVIRVDGIACTVLLPTGQTRRGRLTGKVIRHREATAPVAVGDQVELQPLDDEYDLVTGIQPRRSELIRGAAGGRQLKQVLAANLDQLVIVFAVGRPAPVAARLDRFLVIAAQAGLEPLIVVNKFDLADESSRELALASIYQRLGYQVLFTSTLTGAGIDDLRTRLKGRLSALVGESGVGKSTLLNVIQPGLRLRAGEVSRTGKGRHTTTASDLLPLNDGGFVADTPGLKEITLWGITAEDLSDYFPEIEPTRGRCYFASCSHRQEQGCAVLAALEAGQIAADRYESFLKLRDELSPPRRW